MMCEVRVTAPHFLCGKLAELINMEKTLNICKTKRINLYEKTKTSDEFLLKKVEIDKKIG